MRHTGISYQELGTAWLAEPIVDGGTTVSHIQPRPFSDVTPKSRLLASTNDECFAAAEAPPTPTDGAVEGGKGGEDGGPAAAVNTAGAAARDSDSASDGQPLPNAATTLLRALWRSPGRFHQLGVMRRDSGQFQNRNVRDVDDAVAISTQQCTAGLDVYHACAEFETARGRTAANVSCAHAFWVDVDCGPQKARDGKGYATIAQAAAELAAFCRRSGLPMPTHVVDSGGGLHAYWALTRPLSRETWQVYAPQLKAVARVCGFLADASRTSDIASVLRLPGTLNHKYTPPRLVSLLLANELQISSELMLIAIRAAHSTFCPVLPPRDPNRVFAANEIPYEAGNRDYGAPDLARLADALRHLDPDCDEATWKLHRLAPLAREARLHPEMAVELRALARSWSSGELAGRASKAWATPGAGSGLTGERAFEKEWRRFMRSGYEGKSATLGTIYFDARRAA